MAEVTAASGYNALMNTPFGKGVVYAGTIVDRNVESDMIRYVTNTTALDELTRCGQIIQFDRPARVGPWRPYEKNQDMVSDQPTSSSFCISICKAAYKSIKIDKLDIKRACENWDAYESSFLDDVWKQLSELWHIEALAGMQTQVSGRNVGKKAGRYKNIDLGDAGNPVHLTPTNLVTFLSRLRTTLDEAGRWYDGEMFIIAPPSMITLMLETFFAKQMCCDPMDSVLFKGFKARDIMGFTLVESSRLRPFVDQNTRRLVYPILAGWKDAYAFTGDIIEAELRSPPSNTFGAVYNMLTVYGGGAIYPEALAKGFVTFETDGLVNP